MDADRPLAQSVRATRGREVISEPVAIVIVNYRTPELTGRCLTALETERSAFRKLKIIIVDGHSADGSAEQLSRLIAESSFRDLVTLLALPLNGGFGWANNQAIKRLMTAGERPRYIHLLNPDTEIEAGAVSRLADYLNRNPRVAAVGSQLLDLNGSRAGSAFTFPSIRGEFSRGARTAALDRFFRIPPISIDASTPAKVDWVSGASVMFRVEALGEVGLFDEGFFLYYDETELMWRLRKRGWSVAIEPRSRVRHVAGAATGVHGQETTAKIERRHPKYLYRSRTRFFGLTRGRTVATIAFLAWLAGNAVWRARHLLGISSGKARDHEVRDHLSTAFPLKHDSMAAAPPLDGPATAAPAWMEKGWL